MGLAPHIENACLQASQPATIDRLDQWLQARVPVPTRPDWFFVKLHTHGARGADQAVLLAPMVRFHEAARPTGPPRPGFPRPLRHRPRDV
ncbi:MAG: hypothetical protein WKF75_01765 [Singulisphaera sp.]